MQLYNTLSAKERATLIDQAGEDRLTMSFYGCVQVNNPKLFRDYLFIHWNNLNVLIHNEWGIRKPLGSQSMAFTIDVSISFTSQVFTIKEI